METNGTLSFPTEQLLKSVPCFQKEATGLRPEAQPSGRGIPAVNEYGYVKPTRRDRFRKDTVEAGWAFPTSLSRCHSSVVRTSTGVFWGQPSGTSWDTHVPDMCSLTLERSFEGTREMPPKGLCQPL